MISAALCFSLVQVASAGSPAHCPPFDPPPAEDTIINVTPADASTLPSTVSSASPHTTILLADGTYNLTGNLRFVNPHVSLRSASGNRDAVVLDGGYRTSAAELISISSDHATVADLTIRKVWYHPIHVVGGGHNATLYNLRILDGRQQFIKVNPSGGEYADFGVTACSVLELTAAGRRYIHDNPTPGYLCYTGGLDLHQTWDWVVRDNVIKNIYCTNGGLAQHAIHFFKSNRDPIVERNLLLNNARGIGFGLGTSGFQRAFVDDPFAGTEMEGREGEVMQIGGVIRNNVIHADIGSSYDSGISLESAWKPEVHHNTVYSEEGSFNSAIDVRFSGSVDVVLSNNLYYPRMTLRNNAPTPQENANVLASAEMFVGLGIGDLHLLETAVDAIDQGSSSNVDDDFDGTLRDAWPDVGADEYVDANTRPSVSVDSPEHGSTFDESTPVDFSGSALDLEDGDLSSSISWSSDLAGPLGTGAALTVQLSAGLHLVRAAAIDGDGLDGADEIEVGITNGSCPGLLVLNDLQVPSLLVKRAVLDISTAASVIVGSSGELRLRAGRAIVLDNGFSVLEDGTLRATLSRDPCR